MKKRPTINWQLIVSILSLITALTIGILGLILSKKVGTVQSGVSDIGSSVQRVERGVLANKFTITYPTNGADVTFDDKVLGNTPFPNMNHYIVVTPVKTGTPYVQDRPALVNSGEGTFSGQARFGGAEVGVGEQFIVRILATKSPLEPGPLNSVPADVVFSESVAVRRR
jgi:hypothetical protein